MIKPIKEPDVKMRRMEFKPLEVYELPRPKIRGENQSALDRFHIMQKEFNSPWLAPTVIVTICEEMAEAAIWVE